MATRRKDPRVGDRPMCADIHADDCPPQRASRSVRGVDRKTMQLCAQVERAVHGAIPVGRSHHLSDVVIEAVPPAPDASRLQVVVSIPASQVHRRDAIARALAEVSGSVRAEVARQIHRKRVPAIVFQLVSREGAA